MVVILLGDGDVVDALLVVQVVRVLAAEGPQSGHRRVVNARREGGGHVALLDGRKQERARPQVPGRARVCISIRYDGSVIEDRAKRCAPMSKRQKVWRLSRRALHHSAGERKENGSARSTCHEHIARYGTRSWEPNSPRKDTGR